MFGKKRKNAVRVTGVGKGRLSDQISNSVAIRVAMIKLLQGNNLWRIKRTSFVPVYFTMRAL